MQISIVMKISLICPVWNTPRELLRDCIRSVEALEGATEENFEAIFIDDGSTDGSAALLDAAAKRCPFVKAVHQKNKGNSVARNLGVEMASGDYVAFLDCDDYLYKGFLGNALNAAGTGKDVYHFNVYKRYEKDNPTLYPVFPHCYGDYIFPDFPANTWVFAWSRLVRRSFLLERGIRFPVPGEDVPRMFKGAYRNYVRGEDNYFCALLSAEAEVTKLEPWYGVVHVQRPSSLGKKGTTETDGGNIGLYLMYRGLWNEGVKRGNAALASFADKCMRLHWGLADHSLCPKGWKPPVLEK